MFKLTLHFISFIFLIFLGLHSALSAVVLFKSERMVYDSESGHLKSFGFSEVDAQEVPGVILPPNLNRNDFILKMEGDRLVLHTKHTFYYFIKNEDSSWNFVIASPNSFAQNHGYIVDRTSFFVMDEFGIYIFMSSKTSSGMQSNSYFVDGKYYSEEEVSKIRSLIEQWLSRGRKEEPIFQTYFHQKLPNIYNRVALLIAQNQAKANKFNLPAVIQKPAVPANSINAPDNSNFPKGHAPIPTKGEDGQTTDAWDVVKSFSEDMFENITDFVYTDVPELRTIEDQILRNFIKFELGSVKLLAPAGVGKTYLMQRLAYRFSKGDVPNILKEYSVRTFSGSSIDAGTKYVGTLEARAKALVEVSKVTKVIWFVDEAHTLSGVGTSAGRKANIMQILKPGLASGYLKMLLASTPQEWNIHFSDDAALNRRLAEVRMPTPNDEVLIKILKGWVSSRSLEPLSDEVLKMVIFYSNEFGIEGVQPSKATKLLNELYSFYQFDNTTGPVTLDLLKKSVQSLYGVDPSELDFNKRRWRYDQIVSQLDNLIGQEPAKTAILDRARQIMSGVFDRTRPRYRLLFAGPKGQGKTEILRLLAKAYGQTEPHRIVMSDFTSPYMVDEFKARIGQIIQSNSMSILFFDELEKAHPAIQRILIGALDTGEITYSSRQSGEIRLITLSLKNASVFASTNAGSDYITKISAGKSAIGFGSPTAKMNMDELRKQMVIDGIDEFVLDRLDGIVPFSYLNVQEFSQIIKLQIQKIIKELNEINSISVSITNLDELVETLGRNHFDPQQSMRDVLRLIEDNIRRPISNLIFDSGSEVKNLSLSLENREIVVKSSSVSTAGACESYFN